MQMSLVKLRTTKMQGWSHYYKKGQFLMNTSWLGKTDFVGHFLSVNSVCLLALSEDIRKLWANKNEL